MTGRLIAVKDLAEQWGTSKDYIYDLIKAGDLPVVQLGRGDRNKFRVSEEAAADYIARNTTRKS